MIERRDALATTPARDAALACVEAGIEAGHPRTVVRNAVSVDGDALRVDDRTYDLGDYDEVLVLGGGNAAGHVAAALEAVLGDRIDGGVVVTDDPAATERVTVREGDHPVPSERGVAGARDVLAAADDAGERTLVLAAITGGGSALLPAPAGEVTLSDLQSVTDALLASGADIGEINAVRKHLSALKGGRLARRAAPATVVSLLFSDVVGDDPSVVASGPTAPDASTFDGALGVLDRYGIDAPASVREHLERGAAGGVPETPGPDDPAFDRVTTHVVADARTALHAARDAARERGYEPLVLSARVRGEAREAAKTHVAVAEEARSTGDPVSPPAVILSGGETTVTVRGDGEGGPNQEFALSAALELVGGSADGVAVAAVDTDGIDGATDAAGAVVDGGTVEDPDDARAALADNDACTYLDDRDALLQTGATGTNLNDLRALVVE
ncbi:glycerate kinase type-2 family protein [Halostella salina]|uniref:glycerate kinase type-2 family protein n=1 Tax=Halostella salina TaxID=1547897 RepID=UPI000EF800DF|nr:glycerate kinase [Halostella salina]